MAPQGVFSGTLASVCILLMLIHWPEPSLAGARSAGSGGLRRLGSNSQGHGLPDGTKVFLPGEHSRNDFLFQFRPERFMVIGAGPAGLMAFIQQYRLLSKLGNELGDTDYLKPHPTAKRDQFASITLYEKRFVSRQEDLGDKYVPRFGPDYSRAQILRLDAHAVELLKGFAYGRSEGGSVYSMLFEGESAQGYCLDEVKQPDVLRVGYDNVRFGKPAWLLDESTVYCHIQTKILEEELYAFAKHMVDHSTRSCRRDSQSCVRAEMVFGYAWKEYRFDPDDKQYVSVFENKRDPTKKTEVKIPFDVLISAQGACSGSPGKCAVCLRQQMMHPGGITLGTGSSRAEREADADKARVGPDFDAMWKPADDTVMSWGMTGFFKPGLYSETTIGDDGNVLLTTWRSDHHLRLFGGPIQVRSFVNRDVHYIGLGLPQSVVRKFDLDNPESEYSRDNYFKFFKHIFANFDGHPELTKEYVLNPSVDKAYKPQLFPIVLFKSKDNTALLPTPEGRRSLDLRAIKYEGRPAIVTFQGDEARLPNFVTASGINWGFYGLDRGMTNLKSDKCHGLYNFVKHFIRRHAANDYDGALQCIKESNADAADLSDSLAQRAQRLAEQFRHVAVSTAGGVTNYLPASKVQSEQLRELSQDYVQGFDKCVPEHFTFTPRDSDYECSEEEIVKLEKAALGPFLPQFNAREKSHIEYTDCESTRFCFKKAVERIFLKDSIPDTLEEFTDEYYANVDTKSTAGGRSSLRIPSNCKDFVANSAHSLNLQPVYECVKKSRSLPWSPSGSDSKSRIQPFETRREALILGCGEFSYFGCVSQHDYEEASRAPTARVLPEWAADFHCDNSEDHSGDKYHMMCFNIITGKNGGAYGWFNKDEEEFNFPRSAFE